jgi:molecular chaperone GrpE (heat shock protein)
MSTQTDPKLPKWPFFLGDAVLLALAWMLQGYLRLGHWEVGAIVVCCLAGAVLAVTPYVLEYQALVRRAETEEMISATEKLRNLEAVAAQIGAATAQWQMVQEQSGKTVGTAREIAERIAAEAAAFTTFLQKANDSEKANLRLEVEKLRRAEGDWLQVVVRMLDHIYALHQAAVRSGQRGLIEQLGHFQNACRDVARRIGLTPFAPVAEEAFNPQVHQIPEGQPQPGEGAQVGETIATGYTFQGQLVRPALVQLKAVAAEPEVVEEIAETTASEIAPEVASEAPAVPAQESVTEVANVDGVNGSNGANGDAASTELEREPTLL